MKAKVQRDPHIWWLPAVLIENTFRPRIKGAPSFLLKTRSYCRGITVWDEEVIGICYFFALFFSFCVSISMWVTMAVVIIRTARMIRDHCDFVS